MGRQRGARRANWPKGLKSRVVDGRTYYSFRDPTTGKDTGLGRDLNAAIQGIQLVLRKRAPDPIQQIVSRIEQPAALVKDHVDWVLNTHLPSRRRPNGDPLSKSTLDRWRLNLNKVKEAWGNMDIKVVDRAAVVKLLDPLPPVSHNKARADLEQFFRLAQARGMRADNPVEGTIDKDEVEVRLRLEKKAYDAIYAEAPEWLRLAMELERLSLQRPTDLCQLKKDSWDGQRWWVRQGKSRGHGYGLRRITPHADLAQAIKACVEFRVEDCDYLLNHRPEKKRKPEGMEHWAQLSDERLSRAFAEIRDRLGLYKDIPKDKQAPSFYEIKALGTRLYEEAGWPTSRIQALAGHQKEDTTQVYLDRHKEKWVEVVLG